jgi:rubredoxin
MYKCDICGLVFDEPYIKQWSDTRPDCFRERFKQVLCPGCFGPYFDEMVAERDDEERGRMISAPTAAHTVKKRRN